MSFRKIELIDTPTVEAKVISAKFKADYLANENRRIFIAVKKSKNKHTLYFFDKSTFYTTKAPDEPRKERSDKGKVHTIIKERSDKGKTHALSKERSDKGKTHTIIKERSDKGVKRKTQDHSIMMDKIMTLLQAQGVDETKFDNMRMNEVRQMLIC